MKKLTLLSLSALLLIGLSAFQKPQKPKKVAKKAATSAKIVLSDKAYDVKFDTLFHDFGKAKEGDQVETSFTLTNVGTEPVLIKSHAVQCGCTTPTYSKAPIMPGESTVIKVGFNTNGKVGNNTKTVTLNTNGGAHEFKFNCEVTAKAPVDPMTPNGSPMKLKSK
jgi:hypothetical protein